MAKIRTGLPEPPGREGLTEGRRLANGDALLND